MKQTLAIGLTFAAASFAASSAFAQAAASSSAATFVAETSFLGVSTKDIDEDRAKALKLSTVRGTEVTRVTEGSPAAKAGIKEGDVVVDFNGQPVEGFEHLKRLIRETPVGRQVKIGLWRNGAAQTVTATLEGRREGVFSYGAWPAPEMRIPEMPRIEIPKYNILTQSSVLGILGESLGSQDQLAEFFGVKEGVLVKSVNRNSAAEKAGLKAGDVIVKVEDTPVTSSAQISNALRGVRLRSTVTLTIVRDRKEMPVTVTFDAPPGRAIKAGFRLVPGKGMRLQLLPNNRVI